MIQTGVPARIDTPKLTVKPTAAPKPSTATVKPPKPVRVSGSPTATKDETKVLTGSGGPAGALGTQLTQQTPTQFAASQSAATASSLNQYMNYLATNGGRVNPAAVIAAANAEVNASVSPLLQGLSQEQTAGIQAIQGYTQGLAGAYSQYGPQEQQAYATAEQQQAALMSAESASISNAGNQQAGALAATLAQAGQSTAPAQQAAAAAQGLAGSNYVSQGSNLGQLLIDSANAQAYGAKLPAIAALAGAQNITNLENNISSQAATDVSKAQSQYPTILKDLFSTATTQANNATKNQIAQQNANTNALKARTTASYDAAQARVKLLTEQADAAYKKGELTDARAKIVEAQKIAQIADQIKQEGVNVNEQKVQATVANNATKNQLTAQKNAQTKLYDQGQLAIKQFAAITTRTKDQQQAAYQTQEVAAKAAANAIAAQKAATANLTLDEKIRHDKQTEAVAWAKLNRTAPSGSTSIMSSLRTFQSNLVKWSQGKNASEHWDSQLNGGKGGFVAAPNGVPPLTFQQAMSEGMSLVAAAPKNFKQQVYAAVVSSVNATYPEGTLGRSYSGQAAVQTAQQFVSEGARQGHTAAQILQIAQRQSLIPLAQIRAALRKAFSPATVKVGGQNAPVPNPVAG